MIYISHDNENENLYSDKFLIAVNGYDKHDEVLILKIQIPLTLTP